MSYLTFKAQGEPVKVTGKKLDACAFVYHVPPTP